jgi:hypothetical protein
MASLRSPRTLLAALAILTAMAVPTSAPAAVTIGEDTSSPGPTAPGACGIPSGCTYANLQHPTRQLAVPFDGVIVRWRVQGGGSPVPFTPRVVRPLPGGSFVGAGTGAPETIVGGAERTIPTRLPVKAGDLFGLDVADGGAIRAYNPLPGARFAGWFAPLLADGGTGQLPNSISSPSWSLIYNADVEPDCDGDGFGDETQDRCPTDASTQAPCARTLTLDAKKNRVERGKKVKLSGQLDAPGSEAACESDQTMELQRKRPRRADFATIEQLQTDTAGSFSTREKVKKTFKYRVQVGEGPTCAAEVSNTERVKALK